MKKQKYKWKAVSCVAAAFFVFQAKHRMHENELHHVKMYLRHIFGQQVFRSHVHVCSLIRTLSIRLYAHFVLKVILTRSKRPIRQDRFFWWILALTAGKSHYDPFSFGGVQIYWIPEYLSKESFKITLADRNYCVLEAVGYCAMINHKGGAQSVLILFVHQCSILS